MRSGPSRNDGSSIKPFLARRRFGGSCADGSSKKSLKVPQTETALRHVSVYITTIVLAVLSHSVCAQMNTGDAMDESSPEPSPVPVPDPDEIDTLTSEEDDRDFFSQNPKKTSVTASYGLSLQRGNYNTSNENISSDFSHLSNHYGFNVSYEYTLQKADEVIVSEGRHSEMRAERFFLRHMIASYGLLYNSNPRAGIKQKYYHGPGLGVRVMYAKNYSLRLYYHYVFFKLVTIDDLGEQSDSSHYGSSPMMDLRVSWQDKLAASVKGFIFLPNGNRDLYFWRLTGTLSWMVGTYLSFDFNHVLNYENQASITGAEKLDRNMNFSLSLSYSREM